MAGLRHYNNSGSVNIPWETAQDERLSFMARGVLAYVLSLPDGWEFSIERIARSCMAKVKGSGREAVTSAMRELEDAGYRRVVHERDEAGRVVRIPEFAYRPVPEWAAAAADDRARRSTKPKASAEHTGTRTTASRTTASRTTASRNTARPGETPGGTERRDAVVRDAVGTRETTPENNTHTEVCVSPEQHDAGRLAIERTTHPEAARLLTGPELGEIGELAGALIAAGWTRAALEAKLNRRTNAATHSPRVVLGRVLEQLADEAPPAAPAGPDAGRIRGAALEAARQLPIDDAALTRLNLWLNRAPVDEVRAWLAEPRPLPAER